jgi:nucleoside-diphosphate-sugar epimerase
VHTRSGLVLTPAGGFLSRLLPLARLGLCPRFASGAQVMSWISLTDEIGAIRFLLDRRDISGPVNLTAPEPVTNSAFTAALNAAADRRDLPWLRVPGPGGSRGQQVEAPVCGFDRQHVHAAEACLRGVAAQCGGAHHGPRRGCAGITHDGGQA